MTLEYETNWEDVISWATLHSLCVVMLSLQAVSVWRDPETLFTGFMPVESLHSREAFNPCPLPVPSLYSSPLYMDMFYFHSSCLLAALSAAQQATNSILIGTYLGNVRNLIFLSNHCSLPPILLLPSFPPQLVFITCFTCRVIPHFSISFWNMESGRKLRLWLTFLM